MTRRQMRESCFILLFEKCFSNYSPEEIVEIAKETEEVAVNSTVTDYFLGVEEHLSQIDEMIHKNLKNWNISRISKVSLCLLRLAVYEIYIRKEVDAAVAINEAIEIAKEYSTQEDASYINGVLGAVVRDTAVCGQ